MDSGKQLILIRIKGATSDDGKDKARNINAQFHAIFSEIISNFKRAELLLFGSDIEQCSRKKYSGIMLTLGMCCPVMACQWKSCTFKTIFFSNFRPISELYWWKIFHSRECSIYMSHFTRR